MGEQNEAEVNVHDKNDWGDNEENLERATWEGWALVEVGFAVLLLVFIGIVAFVLGFFEFLISTHSRDPLLGEPAEEVTEGDGIDEDVLVVDDVDGSNQWLGDAESEEIHLSHVGSVVEAHPDEGDDGEDLEDGTEGKAMGGFTQKVKDESEADDVSASLSIEAEAAAVAGLVEFLEGLDSLVLRHAVSDFLHFNL